MSEMNANGCQDLKDTFLGGIDPGDVVLGLKAGQAYQIEIADHGIFVSFMAGIQYRDMDFYSASKTIDPKAATVTWTVADDPVDFDSPQLSRLSNINTVR